MFSQGRGKLEKLNSKMYNTIQKRKHFDAFSPNVYTESESIENADLLF